MNESDPIQDWKISNDHLGPSQYYPIEGLKGASNRAPIMSRVDSLLDSGRNFFQSDLQIKFEIFQIQMKGNEEFYSQRKKILLQAN